MTLRQPIVVTLGHVDHGKTLLLDAIRSTSVQSREAGQITQGIGASEVPIGVIKEICGKTLESLKLDFTIPGLLFIDTPGHEAFANLRKRGGSIADIAVLVIDVNQGIQAQTREAIAILQERKTPFVVALNKVDVLTGWIDSKQTCFAKALETQRDDVKELLDKNVYEIVGALNERGFNAERFDRVEDFTKQLVIVPTSAATREGVAELLLYVAGLAQRFLDLELHEGPGKGSILEVREEKGLGKTLDVILYDGVVREGDEIVFASASEALSSRVKALLKPMPLDEMRDPRKKFKSVERVTAACGVKIACERADEAVAGSALFVVAGEEQKREAIESIKKELGELLFEKEVSGAVLKADALGSLEAVTQLFEASGVPVKMAAIGAPTKKDVLTAASVRAKEKRLGVLFAFNVPVEAEVLSLAESEGVQVFHEKIIYNLVEGYAQWVEEQEALEKREAFETLVLPAKLKILDGCCFRVNDPCIFGVEVLEGRIKKGVGLLNEEGKTVGEIKGIQREKKSIEFAKKGDQVAISVSGPTFGRHVKEKQVLYSNVPKKHVQALEAKYARALTDEEKELLQEIKKLKGLSWTLQ